MVLLIAALVLFTAMHFLPLVRSDNSGWKLWIYIGMRFHDPSFLGSRGAVVIFSFLTFSLLIVGSPFLGNIWVKSLLSWSMAVIFSGVAAAGFWVIVDKPTLEGGFSSGMWCLMISPLLNFAGLLVARPQWLKKSGLPLRKESHAAVREPRSR